MSTYSDSDDDSDNETKLDTSNYNDIKETTLKHSNYDDDDDYIREPDKPKRETLLSHSNYDDDDNIRESDKPIRETLLSHSNYDGESRRMLLHQPNYNEEEYLKHAIEESIKNAEDNYFAMQLEQIKEEEELTQRAIKEVKDMLQLEDMLQLSLLESKKEERNNSLKNAQFQITKLKKIDANFNENLMILEDIIKLYVNCEIDNYEISLDIHTQIFNQIKTIRVDKNELNLIKEILIIKN